MKNGKSTCATCAHTHRIREHRAHVRGVREKGEQIEDDHVHRAVHRIRAGQYDDHHHHELGVGDQHPRHHRADDAADVLHAPRPTGAALVVHVALLHAGVLEVHGAGCSGGVGRCVVVAVPRLRVRMRECVGNRIGGGVGLYFQLTHITVPNGCTRVETVMRQY